MGELLSACSFGILLGMRHALEPDHLAAVSTLATRSPGRQAGALLGASWGLGHTLSLLVLGGGLVLLRRNVSPQAGAGFELLVAVLLLFLGVRAIGRALAEGQRGPITVHSHHFSDGGAGHAHVHGGPASHVHLGRFTLSSQPLLIGLVHGVAGSGALTAMVLANLPTAATRLVYILLFGLGSVLGMALLSGLLGWPLSRLVRRPRLLRAVSAVSGLGSAGYGLYLGAEMIAKLTA